MEIREIGRGQTEGRVDDFFRWERFQRLLEEIRFSLTKKGYD